MKHALERLRRNGLAECVALRTGEKKLYRQRRRLP